MAKMGDWLDFQKELAAQETAIVSMLPRHIPRDRFLASAVAAVKQTPGLLKCTARSLFASVTKSAQDGLLPDGREGVILSYREKEGDAWVDKAQWMPMTFGLRKRARELDSIVVDAQVVYEHDDFVWDQGDDPKLVHKPAKLGTPRGKMIGVYAIYRANGEILHREVMSEEDIEKVRQQSKQPNGVMWTKFVGEAWKKTVVRRGMKSVPCSEPLQTVVQRDDEFFSFDGDRPEDNTISTGRRGRGPVTVVQSSPATNGGSRPLPPTVQSLSATVEKEVAGYNDAEAVEDPPPSPANAPEPPPPFFSEKQETVTAQYSQTVNSQTVTVEQPTPKKRGRPSTPRSPDPELFDSALWAEGCMRALRYADEPAEIPKIESEQIAPHLSEAAPSDIEEVMAVLHETKIAAGLI